MLTRDQTKLIPISRFSSILWLSCVLLGMTCVRFDFVQYRSLLRYQLCLIIQNTSSHTIETTFHKRSYMFYATNSPMLTKCLTKRYHIAMRQLIYRFPHVIQLISRPVRRKLYCFKVFKSNFHH